MTKEEVIAVARKLSADERTLVIAAIDPAEDDFIVTDALRAAIDQRLAEHEADPTNVFPWEQVEAELNADE